MNPPNSARSDTRQKDWEQHVTVATIVERDGRFLMVEEESGGLRVINQPAGHVEPGESISEAALRETMEETGWQVKLTSLIGVYTLEVEAISRIYTRFCFAATAIARTTSRTDPDIHAVHWLSVQNIRDNTSQLRSPLVLTCLEDYVAGKRYPMAILNPITRV